MPDRLLTVPVPHRKQGTLFFCGPATAEMVLSALAVPSPAVPPSWQRQLWDYIETNTNATRPASAPSQPTAPPFPEQKCEKCGGQWNCWGTTPEVLVKLLNASQGVATYTVSKHASDVSATDAILDTLDQDLPGIALVYGWQHWLVVDGYRHSEPGSVTVGGRNVNGVYIRDPEDVPAVHYITWLDWETLYLSYIACGKFKNKMVVARGVRVQAPLPVLAPQAPQAPANIQPLSVAEDAPDPWSREMKSIILPEEAIKRAGEQVVELRTSRMRAALQSAAATSARLVQRLDEPDLYYYIVTFEAASGETARVIVDAFDGTLRQASGIEREGEVLQRYMPSPQAVTRLFADAEREPDGLPFRVRAGMVGEHPVLVWKPCGQSKSPFLPFYQLSVGDSFVYYRIDGQQFDALTVGPA